MKDKLIKLLNVKSIVTIFTTLVFCYLSIVGKIDTEAFMTIFIMIISFYFGTQNGKEQGREEVVQTFKLMNNEE